MIDGVDINEYSNSSLIKSISYDFIKKLPMQYYTYLEEAGNGISGGEKQRIALYRAFFKKYDFYILNVMGQKKKEIGG